MQVPLKENNKDPLKGALAVTVVVAFVVTLTVTL